MSSELQIHSSVLASIVAHSVQAKLQRTCFDSISIERIDVATAPITAAPTHAAVRLQVPLDVFFVAPDNVPPKVRRETHPVARSPGQAIAILELAATGAIVTLRCTDIDLSSIEESFGTGATAAKKFLITSIGTPFVSDLSGVFKNLGVAIPRFSRVDFVAGIVAMRFEPVGAAASRLSAAEDWGLFLDSSAVEKLAKTKLPTDFTSHSTSLVINSRWRPANCVPHVDLEYFCKAPQVGEPAVSDVSGTIGCDFALTTIEAKRLRSTVRWTLDIKLGALVPKFVKEVVEEAITGFMNPAHFGGTPLGDHSFAIESELPDIQFGGARLEHRTLTADATGMIFGGSAELPGETSGIAAHQSELSDDLAICTCTPSDQSNHCQRCQTRAAKKSTSDPAKSQGGPSPKTKWEREILSKMLRSLRKAEHWANSTLPCRDFIAIPTGHASAPDSSRNNSDGMTTSRRPDGNFVSL